MPIERRFLERSVEGDAVTAKLGFSESAVNVEDDGLEGVSLPGLFGLLGLLCLF